MMSDNASRYVRPTAALIGALILWPALAGAGFQSREARIEIDSQVGGGFNEELTHKLHISVSGDCEDLSLEELGGGWGRFAVSGPDGELDNLWREPKHSCTFAWNHEEAGSQGNGNGQISGAGYSEDFVDGELHRSTNTGGVDLRLNHKDSAAPEGTVYVTEGVLYEYTLGFENAQAGSYVLRAMASGLDHSADATPALAASRMFGAQLRVEVSNYFGPVQSLALLLPAQDGNTYAEATFMLPPDRYWFVAMAYAGNGEFGDVIGDLSIALDFTLELAKCDIAGTNSDDNLAGTSMDETICGLEGNDVIDSGGGADLIFGGPGNDKINALAGDASPIEAYGGDGDDEIVGGPGGDSLFGNGGLDMINGEEGDDLIDGGDGDDILYGSTGEDEIYGGGGHDVIAGDLGSDLIFGGDGDDYIVGVEDADEIYGEDGFDKIFGGEGDDLIWGGDRKDVIHGDAGDDFIDGEDGDDVLYGDDDDDFIMGGNGRDIIDGGRGGDELYGDNANDIIYGGIGGDIMEGGQGHDIMYGGPNRDRIIGNNGNDVIEGGPGRDRIRGGPGDDVFDLADGEEDFADGGSGFDDASNSDPIIDTLVNVEVEP